MKITTNKMTIKMRINRIIMAAVLSVVALTVSAQKKVDFSVRAYWDIGNKEPASKYVSDNAFYCGLGAKVDVMYKFTPQLKAGIGTGLEYKDMLSYGFKERKEDKRVDVYYSDEYMLLPVFIKGKYNITKSKVSPFVSVEAGMEYVVNDNDPDYVTHAPHYYAMPAVGVDFNIGRQTRLFIQAGYMMMSAPYYIHWYQYTQNPAEYDKPVYKHAGLGCFELSAGMEF